MTIVRTPTKALGGVTAQEAEALKAHAAKWIANAMSTAPVAPERLVPAIKSLYAAAGLKEPRVVIVASPRVMAFAGGFAAAIWWARKNGKMKFSGAPTNEATRAAADAATDVAADAATDAATVEAIRVTTRAATDAAIRAAISEATYEVTVEATDAATRVATDEATDAVTRATIVEATDEAAIRATLEATDAVTRAAIRWAISAATVEATDEVTIEAIDEAAVEAISAALRGGPFANLAQEMGREFNVSPDFMLQCAQRWWRIYQGGNMWSTWDSYFTAFRDVIGLQLPEDEKYRAWEACAVEGGFRVVHEEFCIVCDRPEVLTIDDQNRPHNATGPSHRWRDGWALYYWHGMRIPAELNFIIHSPEQITVADIEGQTNSELRRVMVDRYGPARFVVDSGAVVVQELPADHRMVGLRSARLLRKEVSGDEPIVFVDLLNSTPEPDGTVKRYMLRVDPNAYGGLASKNVHAAAASTWRTGPGKDLVFPDWRDYAPDYES